jgi:regulatory protein
MEEHIAPPPKIKPGRAAGEKRPPKKITPTYLHNAGLAYLERFPAATAQFRRVMMRKIKRSCRFHPQTPESECVSMLDAVVQKFTDMGLLNDEMYLRGMVHSLRRRGLSAAAILMKLQMKGLTAGAIRAELASQDEDADGGDASADLTAALRLCARKRLGPFRQNGRKTPQQEMASLARHGFGYDVAQHALNMDTAEAEGKIRAAR